jgi:hypothetical protein
MGSTGLYVAILGIGYIAGVWTAFLVLRQPQGAFEDEVSEAGADRQAELQPGRAGVLKVDG